jgi:hypothetical protein
VQECFVWNNSLHFKIEDTVEERVQDVDPPLPDMGVAEGITEGDAGGQGNSAGGEEGDECGDNGGTDGWHSWMSFVAPIPSPSLVLSLGCLMLHLPHHVSFVMVKKHECLSQGLAWRNSWGHTMEILYLHKPLLSGVSKEQSDNEGRINQT